MSKFGEYLSALMNRDSVTYQMLSDVSGLSVSTLHAACNDKISLSVTKADAVIRYWADYPNDVADLGGAYLKDHLPSVCADKIDIIRRGGKRSRKHIENKITYSQEFETAIDRLRDAIPGNDGIIPAIISLSNACTLYSSGSVRLRTRGGDTANLERRKACARAAAKLKQPTTTNRHE